MKIKTMFLTSICLLNTGCTSMVGLETGNSTFDLLYGITAEFVNTNSSDDDCKIADPEVRYSCYEKVDKKNKQRF